MLGFPLLYFKGMRLLMFQLSSFYYTLRLLRGSWDLWGGFRLGGLGFGIPLRGSRSIRVGPKLS